MLWHWAGVGVPGGLQEIRDVVVQAVLDGPAVPDGRGRSVVTWVDTASGSGVGVLVGASGAAECVRPFL